MKNEKLTIDDVARQAGVSKTTISRYLNEKYEYMSESTRRKIEKVVEELEYRPNNIARSLKAQQSKVIGCVIADIGSPFSAYIVKGINDVCKEKGYQVFFVNTDDNEDDEMESIQSLIAQQVDGMIINTSGRNDKYLVELHEQGMPIVLADRSLKIKNKIDTVTTNNYEVTYNSLVFLKEQGYEKVAFFTEDIDYISSRYVRHAAYLDAMAALFDSNGNKYTYYVDSNAIELCEKYLKEFMEKNKGKEKAIFTVNGVTLLHVLTAIQKLGYEIGKDIGVCGFDDWGWASLIANGITTIMQQSYENGYKCAEILLGRIGNEMQDKEPVSLELPAELVARGSTTIQRKERVDE